MNTNEGTVSTGATYTTQMDAARKGIITPEMKIVAQKEKMTEEFFRAVAYNMNATLHLNEAYGNNVHHVIEACFKAFGRALKEAVRIDEKNKDKIVSSKGVL